MWRVGGTGLVAEVLASLAVQFNYQYICLSSPTFYPLYLPINLSFSHGIASQYHLYSFLIYMFWLFACT